MRLIRKKIILGLVLLISLSNANALPLSNPPVSCEVKLSDLGMSPGALRLARFALGADQNNSKFVTSIERAIAGAKKGASDFRVDGDRGETLIGTTLRTEKILELRIFYVVGDSSNKQNRGRVLRRALGGITLGVLTFLRDHPSVHTVSITARYVVDDHLLKTLIKADFQEDPNRGVRYRTLDIVLPERFGSLRSVGALLDQIYLGLFVDLLHSPDYKSLLR